MPSFWSAVANMAWNMRRSNITHAHPVHDFLTANIDREVVGERRIVEIKNVGRHAAKQWGEPGTDEAPPWYLMQAHHYMLVLDYPAADIVAYFGGGDLGVDVRATEPRAARVAHAAHEQRRARGLVQQREAEGAVHRARRRRSGKGLGAHGGGRRGHGLAARLVHRDAGGMVQVFQVRLAGAAAQHGAQVVVQSWLGYARQKNWALANLPIKTDWVFILDADEAITDTLRDELLSLRSDSDAKKVSAHALLFEEFPVREAETGQRARERLSRSASGDDDQTGRQVAGRGLSRRGAQRGDGAPEVVQVRHPDQAGAAWSDHRASCGGWSAF